MNEIETKRKELVKKIDFDNPESGINKGHWTYEDTLQAELKGFNLGVELAQKEIIKIIKNHSIENIGYVHENVNELITKIKQSLEDKK